ncbi:MAG: hypothetical protein II913_03020, partial [Elusimicrobiaceae bacterium]|nr:hypothetical protein [Elusimicrobiaceae bacterium]
LRLYESKHFIPVCSNLIAPNGPDTTISHLRMWKQQILLIMSKYEEVYNELVDKLANLADIYHIPVYMPTPPSK